MDETFRSSLLTIGEQYRAASATEFAGNVLASFIRREATAILMRSLGPSWTGMRVIGSAGLAKWADSPWLAILDPLVTETPQAGYYVAWLYPRSLKRVVLSLQIGTTSIRASHGDGESARREIASLVQAIRSTVPEHSLLFSNGPIALEPDTPGSRAAFYERAHAFGRTYDIEKLPGDGALLADGLKMLRLYRLVTERIGDELCRRTVTPEHDVTVPSNALLDWENPGQSRYHRRIERNRRLAARAKELLGYECQVCGFDFAEVYGAIIGAEFIEAHHLTPLSELSKSGPLKLNPATDFAVLCANCHAMIHRPGAPKTVSGMRDLRAAQRTNFAALPLPPVSTSR